MTFPQRIKSVYQAGTANGVATWRETRTEAGRDGRTTDHDYFWSVADGQGEPANGHQWQPTSGACPWAS